MIKTLSTTRCSLLPREQYQNQQEDGATKGDNYLLEVDKPLVIPANKKVRFLITSDDVIHAWWVPAFAVKQDANPGLSMRHGPRLMSLAPTADNVPSYAVKITALCPLLLNEVR